jgi:hypothetical protein
VHTRGSPAGDVVAAFVLLLPAATARNTPAPIIARPALLMAVEVLPPSDMLATVPLGQLRVAESDVTKFMPATTPDVVPEPEASSTFTANSDVFFATPYVFEPTVPATCVPWPLPSELEVSA